MNAPAALTALSAPLRNCARVNHYPWDHLYFMSGYQLDELPNGCNRKIGGLADCPNRFLILKSLSRFRHYGFNSIQEIIERP